MLKCKDITHHASDYIDHNTSVWMRTKIVLHLFFCKCCRKFMKHLRITNLIARNLAKPKTTANAELILQKVKADLQNNLQK